FRIGLRHRPASQNRINADRLSHPSPPENPLDSIGTEHALVVCFTASEQSIQGCAVVASSVSAQWARLKGAERENEKVPGYERRIFPILMRIEPSEKDKLDAARAHVREVFRMLPHPSARGEDYWSKAEVGYWPFYAFEEVLAVFGDRFRTDSLLL